MAGAVVDELAFAPPHFDWLVMKAYDARKEAFPAPPQQIGRVDAIGMNFRMEIGCIGT